VTATSQGHRHKWSTHDEGRRIRREEASGACEMQKTGGGREGRTRARSLVSCTRGDEPEGEAAKQRRRPDATSSKEPQCSQAWRAPFVHAEVRAGATQRGFDAQRKTGVGGRPAMIASQQVERTMELQNLEVRAKLNRRVRKCERKCFASGRLGSIPQVCARARQRATREQVKGQWCESSTGTVCRRCDRAR
jgi:hypothetical protein